MVTIKSILITGFLGLCLLAKAQDHKFALGLTGSADIYMLDFGLYDKNQPFFPGIEKSNNPGYSYGMRIQYNFNEQLFLRSGLFYAKRVFSYRYQFAFNDPDDHDIPVESRLEIYHLGVPLMLGHHVINKEKIKLSPSAGIVGEFNTEQEETTTYEDNTERESAFLHKHLNHMLSAQLSIGVEYHLNSRIFITAEPYAKVGMNLPADPAEDNKLNSWGGILSFNCNL